MQPICSTPGCRRAADPNVSIPPSLCISCYYRYPTVQEAMSAITKQANYTVFICNHPGCIDTAMNGSNYCSGHATEHEKTELGTLKPSMPEPYTNDSLQVRTKLVPVTTAQDPVVEANRKMLLDRSTVGIQKYGTTLHGNKLSHKQWLQHALEEALDLANYLQAQIMKIDAEAKDHKETK